MELQATILMRSWVMVEACVAVVYLQVHFWLALISILMFIRIANHTRAILSSGPVLQSSEHQAERLERGSVEVTKG